MFGSLKLSISVEECVPSVAMTMSRKENFQLRDWVGAMRPHPDPKSDSGILGSDRVTLLPEVTN